MKFRILTLALLLTVSGVFYSCAEGSDVDRAADEMVVETENVLSDLGAQATEESDKLEAEFKEAKANLSKRMKALEADMDGVSDDVKQGMKEEFNVLQAWSHDIDNRMDRVGSNMESSWKSFKGDVTAGWKDFSKESGKLLKDIERNFDPEGKLD
ncbi:MAG: hypothetical protein ACI81P_002225 [Neolewinella sp.]|jgi:uncharacterized protein YicC (UPF0701 family)